MKPDHCNSLSPSGHHLCALPRGHHGWHQSDGVTHDHTWNVALTKEERLGAAKFPRLRMVGRPCRTCGQHVRPGELRDHGQLCVYCAPPKIKDKSLHRPLDNA